MYVYIQLNHFAVQQKLTHYKSTILQFFLKIKKRPPRNGIYLGRVTLDLRTREINSIVLSHSDFVAVAGVK